ncbi:MAG: amidase domain-containing protein [Oscillospiraceae bacterium]|nr:amidase domain-containing protein [Oscillospiraceae bacterium]
MKAYDRVAALAYARRWALGRNPAYYDFTALGGDCTNFVSQCLFAGVGVMNDTSVTGWYYRSASDRTASWTGVEYLYRFLTKNRGSGPVARPCSLRELRPGDVIQLGDSSGRFYHCLLVLRPGADPSVAAHDDNALDRALSSYHFERARFLQIEGGMTE